MSALNNIFNKSHEIDDHYSKILQKLSSYESHLRKIREVNLRLELSNLEIARITEEYKQNIYKVASMIEERRDQLKIKEDLENFQEKKEEREIEIINKAALCLNIAADNSPCSKSLEEFEERCKQYNIFLNKTKQNFKEFRIGFRTEGSFDQTLSKLDQLKGKYMHFLENFDGFSESQVTEIKAKISKLDDFLRRFTETKDIYDSEVRAKRNDYVLCQKKDLDDIFHDNIVCNQHVEITPIPCVDLTKYFLEIENLFKDSGLSVNDSVEKGKYGQQTEKSNMSESDEDYSRENFKSLENVLEHDEKNYSGTNNSDDEGSEYSNPNKTYRNPVKDNEETNACFVDISKSVDNNKRKFPVLDKSVNVNCKGMVERNHGSTKAFSGSEIINMQTKECRRPKMDEISPFSDKRKTSRENKTASKKINGNIGGLKIEMHKGGNVQISLDKSVQTSTKKVSKETSLLYQGEQSSPSPQLKEDFSFNGTLMHKQKSKGSNSHKKTRSKRGIEFNVNHQEQIIGDICFKSPLCKKLRKGKPKLDEKNCTAKDGKRNSYDEYNKKYLNESCDSNMNTTLDLDLTNDGKKNKRTKNKRKIKSNDSIIVSDVPSFIEQSPEPAKQSIKRCETQSNKQEISEQSFDVCKKVKKTKSKANEQNNLSQIYSSRGAIPKQKICQNQDKVMDTHSDKEDIFSMEGSPEKFISDTFELKSLNESHRQNPGDGVSSKVNRKKSSTMNCRSSNVKQNISADLTENGHEKITNENPQYSKQSGMKKVDFQKLDLLNSTKPKACNVTSELKDATRKNRETAAIRNTRTRKKEEKRDKMERNSFADNKKGNTVNEYDSKISEMWTSILNDSMYTNSFTELELNPNSEFFSDSFNYETLLFPDSENEIKELNTF